MADCEDYDRYEEEGDGEYEEEEFEFEAKCCSIPDPQEQQQLLLSYIKSGQLAKFRELIHFSEVNFEKESPLLLALSAERYLDFAKALLTECPTLNVNLNSRLGTDRVDKCAKRNPTPETVTLPIIMAAACSAPALKLLLAHPGLKTLNTVLQWNPSPVCVFDFGCCCPLSFRFLFLYFSLCRLAIVRHCMRQQQR